MWSYRLEPPSPFVHQAALVEWGEVAVVRDLLVTGGDRVRAQGVDERGAPGVVVDFTVAVLGIATQLFQLLALGGRRRCCFCRLRRS